MDIRILEAQRFAEENGFYIWPGRCDRCQWPLFRLTKQDVPFCAVCYRNAEQAQRGRDLLERLAHPVQVMRVGNEVILKEVNLP